jgi:hypothetical protein
VNEIHSAHPEVPGTLFMSVGAKDSHSMTGDLTRLETQIAALVFPRLNVSVRRFPRKTHMNAMPVTFVAGMAALFGQVKPAF